MNALEIHSLKQQLFFNLMSVLLALTPLSANAVYPLVLPKVPYTSGELAQEIRQDLWMPPLSGTFAIESPYVQPPHQYAAGHRGIDMRVTSGTPVTAPQSGTVHFAGTVVDRNLITVRVTDDLLYTIEPVETVFKVGDPVHQGQPLGTVSHGGHCVETCIHLGVRVNGNYVNPLRFFAGTPRLLPLEP